MSVDIAITDPCVVFALRRESMYFRRRFPFQQRFPGAPCLAHFRGSPPHTVLMLETGVGAGAMETALRWCLGSPRFGELPYRPRCVLSVGFSGALRPAQRVGDLILASEIVDEAGNGWSISDSDVTPNMATTEVIAGRLLTVSELVSDPHDKARLGERYDALAVDMETAVLARICAERGIPLVCLRVISDDLQTRLSPQLVGLLRRGRVSPMQLLGAVLCHPNLIGELYHLAGQTRGAAKQLVVFGSLLAALDRSPPLGEVRRVPLPPPGKSRSNSVPCPWLP
jgi:nucleoside phosphorylase